MIQKNMKGGNMQGSSVPLTNTIQFAGTFQHISSNIQNKQCNDYSNQWILDSRATDHIIAIPLLL